MSRRQLVLGLGSNIDRRRHIARGVETLREHFGTVILSPVYESPSAGFEGPNFYNLVAVAESDLPLDAVLGILRDIEGAEGRTRGDDAFVSRTLDIDVLLYGDLVLRDDGYDIPREEITRYAFVLKPLADVLPAQAHPETGIDFGTMWRTFRANHDVSALSKTAWSP